MEWMLDPQSWIALVTLTALEIVLGIDNVIFISILSAKLPLAQQARARTTGLALATITRVGLLLSLTWVMRLTEPFFSLFQQHISGRDLILLVGGLFLIWKSTREIHEKLEGQGGGSSAKGAPSFRATIVQILLLDIVFSLDSVITAVGMANRIEIMIAAVVFAVGVMIFFAQAISGFVERHPTIKILALSFLLLIGVTLIAEGLHQHVSKGYIYFAMAFSVFVEAINLKIRHREGEPVKLRTSLIGRPERGTPRA
jgi:predicted tellurium resistance membrane protein TerC